MLKWLVGKSGRLKKFGISRNNMLYFKHKDSSKNIGLKTPKKFVVMFEIRSYVLREDGSKELVKEDGTMDLLSMLKDEKKELIGYFKKEQIEW